MKSPGMMLREAREEHGLTLSDVAAMTRIPKTMLGHLEADRFEEYVAEVFVRGHLRNYARELRVDSEALLQCYEHHTGRRRTDPMAEARRIADTSASRASRQVMVSVNGAPTTRARSARRQSDASSGMKSVATNFSVGFRPSHIVAVILVLLGILVMVSFLSSNRATAQDPATFPEADASAWALEQDIQETRWLLEQTDAQE